MYFAYILYSVTRDKYYVGSCEDIDKRIIKHNTNHSGFAGKTGDWVLKWNEQHKEKTEAFKREKQIKAWKSRKMIEKLINEKLVRASRFIIGRVTGSNPVTPTKALQKCEAFLFKTQGSYF